MKDIFSLNKLPTIAIVTAISFLFFAPPVFAAAPDGLGPWADKVISTNQGLMKNGLAVPAIRSNPLSALGVAEDNAIEGNFYSLGFGGKITLGFKNGIKNGVIVVEATNPNYPLEKATVEVSPDKHHWYTAGTVTQDGQVNLPRRAGCIHYVRLTDASNPADFSDATADGYDVDGVKGNGERCTIKKQDDDDKRDDHDRDQHNGKGRKCDHDRWESYTPQQEHQIDSGE